MDFFRKKVVKCFFCNKNEDMKKAYKVQYKSLQGIDSLDVCEDCAKTFEQLRIEMEEYYND